MYYSSLCLFARNYSMDEKAEDIVQDVFVEICERNIKFANKNLLKAYLYQSVKNKALNIIRRQQVNKKYENWLNLRSEKEEPFYNYMIKEESYRILFRAIDELPLRQKEILLLKLDGMKNQEIADHLNLSINTVRSHKTKAMRTLKDKLKHMYPLVLAILMGLPE